MVLLTRLIVRFTAITSRMPEMDLKKHKSRLAVSQDSHGPLSWRRRRHPKMKDKQPHHSTDLFSWSQSNWTIVVRRTDLPTGCLSTRRTRAAAMLLAKLVFFCHQLVVRNLVHFTSKIEYLVECDSCGTPEHSG